MNATQNETVALSTIKSLRVPDKTATLQSLLRLLDAVIFLQLGALYLQDNLTLFLLLRAVSQAAHNLPAVQLPPVILINVLCFATHLLQARPEAKGWASRGYLHGGLIIDFVGEQGPVSKWRLASMDLLIFGLQLVVLVVGNERLKAAGDPAAQEPHDTPDTQDLEAAEEGRVTTSARAPAETEDGIELQSLLPEGSGQDTASNSKPLNADLEEDIVELDMRRGLTTLLRRGRTSAGTSTSTDTTPESAGIAEILSRIAAARARAA
ncbi:uncharacterized protein A1O9_04152 [Exophiala aquamarina CBS 119918]|uniref:DUF1746 domain-containing protein n=1 Tax=Exophiala aquamarina CBS 119918 TaxID=1182545 RepID=A0A072PJ49_9EURO|nr:uncharacterized protein A1O9_04152 [Exophiala aquamarina CBS 119918]KEF59308.1 hypothetical protein A1O9_04152 [Exophiala aquamarina CBS 119918]